MPTLRTALAVALLGLTACSPPPANRDAAQPAPTPAPSQAEAQRVKAHVDFLADDLLEGREAGTRGYDLAAHYVASQFSAWGLQPAGDNGGWLQTVPLLQGERLQEGAQLSIERPGLNHSFAFETDYLPGVGFDQAQWSVTAGIVFVGQGVVAPEFKHDDLAGVDLRGKVAVLLSGAPASFPNDQRAFYSSGREKLRLLAERGAVGVIYVGDPVREAKSPWARGAANWRRPSMRLRDAEGRPVDTFPQLQASASLSAAAADTLFKGAPQSAEEVFKRLKDGSLQAFDLPGQVTLAGRSTLTPKASTNVVAKVAGSDPTLALEHIVYSAHLDHVGIGAEVNGDAIYNGALDNALGVGLLLETARLAATGPAVPRSRLYIALTAEEKGLLGAEHFAGQPSVEGDIVANINMDMPVILSAQDDVVPIGIEHSSLKTVVEQAAGEIGVKLSPDPFPEEVVFVRSDQFAFIRRGVPAVYLDGGIHSTVPGVDGKDQLDGFLRTHYHQPSDQADLPIHYPSAARLADLNHRIGLQVGRDAERPRWNPGNFFGGKFAADRH